MVGDTLPPFRGKACRPSRERQCDTTERRGAFRGAGVSLSAHTRYFSTGGVNTCRSVSSVSRVTNHHPALDFRAPAMIGTPRGARFALELVSRSKTKERTAIRVLSRDPVPSGLFHAGLCPDDRPSRRAGNGFHFSRLGRRSGEPFTRFGTGCSA